MMRCFSGYRAVLLWLLCGSMISPTMAQDTEQLQPDAPEYFSQPELFLTDMKNLDLQKIVWQFKTRTFLTRPDSVGAIITIYDNKQLGRIYAEDISHPSSPFSYRNTYDEKGALILKHVNFYGSLLYDTHECKDGKCTPSPSKYEAGMNPVIPMEHTRAMILKEAGIDLYDTSTVKRASFFSQDNKYYCYMITIYSDESLFDAETGKVLYQRHILSGEESRASVSGEMMNRESIAYKKSEKMLKKTMKEGDRVYLIFRKTDTKDTERFYEVFVANSSDRMSRSRSLISFLLDHKKEKILYQCKASLPFMAIEGMPFVEFWEEYQQHLKMIEAEEEKPGPLGWFRKK